jgi:hypothetical protein
MKFRKSSASTAVIIASLCLAAPWVMAQSKKLGGNTPPPTAGNDIAQATLAKCATGFIKSKESKGPNGELNSFECKTPVLKCPKNAAHPALYLTAKAETNENQNPDIAAVTLRYTCTYSSPVG